MKVSKKNSVHAGVVPAAGWRGIATGMMMAAVTAPVVAEQEATAERQVAADIDWVPRYQLDAAIADLLPPYCGGAYIEPNFSITDPTRSREDQVVNANALEASFNNEGILELEGEVNIQQGDLWVQSDAGQFNQNDNTAEAQGNVRIRLPGTLVTGSSAQVQTDSGQFVVNDATYLVHSNELRGESKSISRPKEHLVVIKNGRYTTCAPSVSDWSFSSSTLRLNNKTDRGEAFHSVFRIADIPVFYLPYINFPISNERHTGFLFPEVGSSNANGIFASAPFYWNIAPNWDATYTPQAVGGRGFFQELEVRNLDSFFGATQISGGFIDDDEEFGEENFEEDPNIDTERWGLSIQNAAIFGAGWVSELDYNVISDDDYLDDLNKSVEIDDAVALNQSYSLSYFGSFYDFQLLLQGFQTIDDDILAINEPFERLPEINFNLDHRFGGLPLEVGLESQYVFFERSNNDELPGLFAAEGSRINFEPSLALPFEAPFGYIRPQVTLKQTSFFLEDQPDGSDNSISRTLPVTTVDAGLFFDRNFSFAGGDYRQSLEPRLFYVVTPFQNQDDIPDFDTTVRTFRYTQLFEDDRFSGEDRVGDTNRLTVGLTTRFTDLNSGREVARFAVGQIFNYDDEQVDLFGAGVSDADETPVAAEFEFKPFSFLDIRTTGVFDVTDNSTEQGDTRVTFHTPDYSHIVNFSHSYISDEIGVLSEQTNVSAVLPVTDQLSLIGQWSNDLITNESLGTLAGFEYRTCCWRVQVVSQTTITDDEELDQGLLVQFVLKGVTGIGNGLEGFDRIPNFNQRERVQF